MVLEVEHWSLFFPYCSINTQFSAIEAGASSLDWGFFWTSLIRAPCYFGEPKRGPLLGRVLGLVLRVWDPVHKGGSKM